jgi:CheY-like chemotaxis protein
LPLASTGAQSPPSRPPAGQWSRSGDLTGVKILVVDDDADSRELMDAFLSAAGAELYQASSVPEALRLARDVAPDVLVSDIAMPDQDGYVLLEKLRGKAGAAAPRAAIAVTAQATRADRERALAAGFDRHVAKPFDPKTLIELVLEVLAGSPK